MEKYSFKKGLLKGLVSLIAVVGAIATFTGYYDINIWDLVVEHLKPTLSALTIGGALTMLQNYIKFKATH